MTFRHFLDLDFPAYLLLYGITFYNITDEAIERLDIPNKDKEIIKKVEELCQKYSFPTLSSQAQTYLDLMYRRYTKHLLGWKKASETRLNQKFLLNQMQECVLIFSMRNLHLNDLSDSKGLDATQAKEPEI